MEGVSDSLPSVLSLASFGEGEPAPRPKLIEPRDIIWSLDNPPDYDLQVEKVLQITLETIEFSKRKDRKPVNNNELSNDEINRNKREVKSANKEHVRTYQMLKANLPFLEELTTPLFWLIHVSTFFPEWRKEIRVLNARVSKLWHDFIYPLRTSGKGDQKAIDKLLLCIPYFLTQAIQDMFIRLLRGNPITMEKSFRMQLCSMIVRMFTGVAPIDTLLKSRLAFYFHFPPQADIPDQPPLSDDDKYEKVTLESEDIKTLIDVPHRVRPVQSHWHVAAVSQFIGTSAKRETVPLTRDAVLVVQMPKNGEADWTTDLPPLLPPIAKDEKPVTVDTYKPMEETRSLMHRSRRPNIIPDYMKARKAFVKREKERRVRNRNSKYLLEGTFADIRSCQPAVLTKFVDDLRQLQLEKKRGETPEFGIKTPGTSQSHSKKNSPRTKEEKQ